MSGQGAPRLDLPGTSDLRVAVVAASWHEQVMGGLVAGATRALDELGASYEVIRVPGAFELPVVAKAATASGYDAVVALETGVPVGFGLLTCDTEEQALARAGLPGSVEDKGREAVEAALAVVLTLRGMSPKGSVGFAS